MAVQNQRWTWAFDAKANIESTVQGTGPIYKAVSEQTGDIAAKSLTATGILQETANSGQHVTSFPAGIMKYTAAAAISSTDIQLAVTTSGYMKVVASGDWVCGKNLSGAVTSGSIGTGLFNFANPHYIPNSLALGLA